MEKNTGGNRRQKAATGGNSHVSPKYSRINPRWFRRASTYRRIAGENDGKALALVADPAHTEVEVGSIERRDVDMRLRHPQHVEDVAPRRRGRAAGQRHRARSSEHRTKHADPAVDGAKIVAPFGD